MAQIVDVILSPAVLCETSMLYAILHGQGLFYSYYGISGRFSRIKFKLSDLCKILQYTPTTGEPFTFVNAVQ